MSINYQFGDVDAHGALIRAQAASLEAEHQAIVRDVLAAGDFWGGAGSVACQEFITQLGRNFQVIYEQANSHGQKVQSRRQQHGQHRQRRRVQLGLTPHPSNGAAHQLVCGPVVCRLCVTRPPANAESATRGTQSAEPPRRTRARPCRPTAAWKRGPAAGRWRCAIPARHDIGVERGQRRDIRTASAQLGGTDKVPSESA